MGLLPAVTVRDVDLRLWRGPTLVLTEGRCSETRDEDVAREELAERLRAGVVVPFVVAVDAGLDLGVLGPDVGRLLAADAVREGGSWRTAWRSLVVRARLHSTPRWRRV